VRCAESLALQDNKIRCLAMNDTSFDCNFGLQNQTNFYQECSLFCPQPCKYSYYEVKNIGYGDFPSTRYADVLRKSKNFTSKFTYDPNSPLTNERIRENVMKANIYFSSVEVDYYEEVEKTDFNSLLATLGGGFDLFLGISVLSFFEAIDVVVAWFEVFILKAYAKKK
jgi:hypothetical protein